MLVERGAVLVDSDLIAREVVAKGSAGLARVVAEFGPEFVTADGELDRPRMAAAVFGDEAARSRLNAIVHPLVRARSTQLLAAAPPDAIVVQDVPLLVEGGMGAGFAMVVVVHADADTRVRRLVGSRGMTEDDARARIKAQADDEARRAAADVWLDNSGTAADLQRRVDALWSGRLVPFRDNIARGEPAALPTRPVDPDPDWPRAAARLAARVAAAAGERGRGVAHVGPTAVPGMVAPDVVDLQLAVGAAADAEDLDRPLREVGFVPAGDGRRSADPGRPARLHVCTVDDPRWRSGLLVRDWLCADAAARAEVAATSDSAADLGRWVRDLADRAEAWARSSNWDAPLG
jgi:dephospho-CoA kinase